MQPTEKSSPQRARSSWITNLPALVIAGLILPHLVWIAEDQSVWPWDPAWYAEVTAELWYTLLHDPLRWPRLMLQAFGSKAPGIAWFGQLFVPLGLVVGSIEAGLLLSVVAVQAGTLFLSYGIARELSGGDRLVGIAACGFMASAPLFAALSNQYLVEPLQLFAVTYFFRVAVMAPRWDRPTIATHLLLGAALAMAAKASSPLYCVFPGMIGLRCFRRAPRPVSLRACSAAAWRRPGLVAAVVLLALVIAWYVKNFRGIFDFVRQSSSGEVALAYGREDVFFNKALFWLSAAQANFFVPQVMVGFLLLNVAILLWRFCCKPPNHRLQNGAAIVLSAALAQVMAVLIVFSLNINEEQRYLLPLLPSVMILCMGPLFWAPQRRFAVAAIILAAVQFSLVQAQLLSLIPENPAVSHWLMPPNADGPKIDELSRLVEETCPAAMKDRTIICGVEYPWLNGNSLAFYAVKAMFRTKHRCYFTSLGYAAGNVDRAWERLERLRIPYFISVAKPSQSGSPDFVNKVSLPILERIEKDPRFERQAFDSRFSILLYCTIHESCP